MIVVFIALEKLNPENGLFLGPGIEMSVGQDVVIKGDSPVVFPGNGGGHMLMLFLRI